MPKLPSYRRLNEQDYPEKDQELVRQLSESLNYGIEVLYATLNGGLTIKDNISSTFKEIDVQVDASGKPSTKTVIKKTTTDRSEGLLVLSAQNLTNSSVYPTSAPFISYTETTDSIIINNITGLPAGNLFRIKIVAIR